MDNRRRRQDLPSKRGKVSAYSGGSRRRLRRRLVKFDWRTMIERGRVVWLTLTARDGDVGEFKGWLSAWRHRLFAYFPGAWFCWGMEFQGRGVPHFHLLVVLPKGFGGQATPLLVAFWREVAGPDNALEVSQHGRDCKSIAGIAAYISDLGKKVQRSCGSAPGRFWGFRGPWRFDMVLPDIRWTGLKARSFIRRFVRSLRASRRGLFHGAPRRCPVVRDSVEFFDAGHLFVGLRDGVGFSSLDWGGRYA